MERPVTEADLAFEHVPETDQSFENALAKARAGERLTVDDAIELLTTGSDSDGIDRARKELVLEAADRRRAEVVGEEVTFVANLNNNVTTACNVGCLFCNFKDAAHTFERGADVETAGFTKTPAESREAVAGAVDRGIYEVTSVSGLHPAFALDEEHLEILDAHPNPKEVNYKPPERYATAPGTYAEQLSAMSVDGVHVHSMTPEEGYHARRGTDWSYEEVYSRLKDAGLDTVPGTAAEILVDEVRDVICPGKITTDGWLEAMTAAANVGLGLTATIMYGHVENEAHRAMHLKRVRDLQERVNGAITEFVPLSFVHQNTPLFEHDVVTGGASTDEDELMIAVSRLFLDNVEHIQSSWVKYGDEQGLKMLNCGADDFMGTILSEEITKRAGGGYGEFRSVGEYVEMISSIGRVPVERSTDYEMRRVIDPEHADPPLGPELGPKADGTPLLTTDERRVSADD
ncbi:7,8-didemethyl-8-hydroxy-5-deazariboflavin synthase subunit 2 [Natrialba magadii ATCC 43099]|uniref:7,8-didemethyl-8-hydroxy-5-deazariboflavin synthase subunit 2 n=1 Tax=Natrialba magadii (strain ATCC 43099 / DSM 3394 / CCM 3739 / CIP 104546 / IAM 13178 / JCM 8861 / NBRC 102185 / NCIMB 2190 / MS3) TaxID=547559 RepID=D3SZ04_NATMM|nr:7,8-didemethyl-8-hydroxy-5-deazariboflavin synthase subunit CofH [Natrialba magadii]ADD06196.1 7,8-didemethyl-8-hydroxy-5-deazariboflavin synthase subunit 2 [Natrialba magadii ATCC 43099]ELY30805.1 FO synthase subunit 2 [Natrialba magadii ATCC 43099]